MIKFNIPDMYVKVYDEKFSNKQRNLYSALEAAEKEHENKLDTTNHKSKKQPKVGKSHSFTKNFRGKESIFKVPIGLPPRVKLKNIAMANKSPKCGKWIKYSLADVEEMSENSNKSAALSFLKELSSRNSVSDDPSNRVILEEFKPTFKKRDKGSETPKTNFQTTRKVNKNSKSEESKTNNHLMKGSCCSIKLKHLELDNLEE